MFQMAGQLSWRRFTSRLTQNSTPRFLYFCLYDEGGNSPVPGKWALSNLKGEQIIYNETADPVKLDLSAYQGLFKARWIDAADGNLSDAEEPVSGGKVVEMVPAKKNLVLWITKNVGAHAKN